MADNWIPVREQLPEDSDWKIVQTQDGTVFPATFANNKWTPLFRGGLVEHLMHGKVAYWQPTPVAYPYVQCKCGSFYLQAEGRKECPICATFHIERTEKPEQKRKKKEVEKEAPKEEAVPFTDPIAEMDDFDLLDE